MAHEEKQHGSFAGQPASIEENALLGAFLSRIAHKLNNHLGAVVLAALNLRSVNRETVPPDFEERCLRDIEGHAKAAGGIIKKVVRFSEPRGDSQGKADVRAALEQSAEALQDLLLSQGTALVLSPAIEHPVAELDQGSLEFVLGELITNAIQAGAQEIVCGCTSSIETRTVIIDVEDDGEGIDENDLDRVCEPFFSRRKTGLGLGLPICRRLIEHAGGSIKFDRRPEKRTVVSVVLPRAG